MTAMNNDASIKFASGIEMPGLEGLYQAFFITGRTYLTKDGQTRIDSHVIYYCCSCGVHLPSIVDDYMPPLLEDKDKPKSNLTLL